MNLRDALPGAAALSEKWLGLSAKRSLPKWRADTFLRGAIRPARKNATDEVVLLADTFNNYFEPENLRAALRVLEAARYTVHIAYPRDGGRPLCCGRTFLSAGLIDQARAEGRRMIDALTPYARRNVPIVGLEPSCLFTLRDEFLAMFVRDEVGPLADQAMLFEEFLSREAQAGKLKLDLRPLDTSKALLHGHCHQKAFGVMSHVERVLKQVPGLSVETIASSCCGMAGAFGYEAEHYDVSMRMGEANLLPAARAADKDTLLVADGTSCRHQIKDGASREALHVARVLERALAQ
jgi:Fe-S oxidoreductase